jgi:hypothetical protein
LEHNVRFGDPECQTLMIRAQGDLTDALLKVRWVNDDNLWCMLESCKLFPFLAQMRFHFTCQACVAGKRCMGES